MTESKTYMWATMNPVATSGNCECCGVFMRFYNPKMPLCDQCYNKKMKELNGMKVSE